MCEIEHINDKWVGFFAPKNQNKQPYSAYDQNLENLIFTSRLGAMSMCYDFVNGN